MSDRTEALLAELVELQRRHLSNQERAIAQQEASVALQRDAVDRQRKALRGVWALIALVILILLVPVLFYALLRAST